MLCTGVAGWLQKAADLTDKIFNGNRDNLFSTDVFVYAGDSVPLTRGQWLKVAV